MTYIVGRSQLWARSMEALWAGLYGLPAEKVKSVRSNELSDGRTDDLMLALQFGERSPVNVVRLRVCDDPERVLGFVERMEGVGKQKNKQSYQFWVGLLGIMGVQANAYQDDVLERPSMIEGRDGWSENDTSTMVFGRLATGLLVIHTFDMVVEESQGEWWEWIEK